MTANYCDSQMFTIGTLGTRVNIETTMGLTGTTKCTYVIKVQQEKGAPAFRISKLDQWMF